LDALIFTDTTCDHVSFLLTLGRVAPIQAAFLGTPITSGDPAIDYFMSADVLESPDRTIMMSEDDSYTEQQVVLLGGQGVWYPAPALPLELAPPPPSLSPHLLETATFGEHRHSNAAAAAQDLSAHAHNDTAEEVERTLPGITSSAHRNAAPESEDTIGDMRSDQQSLATAEECDAGRAPREQRRNVLRAELKDRIGVDKGSVVYMCAQSIFKLHPRFDTAAKGVLEASISNHIVFTEGRKPKWTATFRERLRSTVGNEMMTRVIFVPRTTEYFSLLASAEVALHPFPFGGSKTSADALALGVPTVAMAGKFAFGRMAQSFYKTMGLEKTCCIASDVARQANSAIVHVAIVYVSLAARLGRDVEFRNRIVDLIDQRQWALWERRDEARMTLKSFFARFGGLSPPTPEEVSKSSA
ncbi:unnamed protein product, partial [Pylaiella littoralis]